VIKTTIDDNQAPAAVQAPSDNPQKLTRNDLENLVSACDDAVCVWVRNKEQSSDDEGRYCADTYIQAYTELSGRLKEELSHCERCRRVAPLLIVPNPFAPYSECCEACVEELEARANL
jgi:hypothetical protein